MVLLLNLIDSRVGRALAAIHGAEDAAGAMGIPTARYKLNTFVLSAVFAAMAGVLLTHYNGGIGPSEASVMKSVRYVAIVAVGGMANLWGALSMSLVLNFLSLRGYFGSFDDAVFGVILILIMLFAPDGLLRRQSPVRSETGGLPEPRRRGGVMTLLSVRGLGRRFGGLQAVNDVSFTCATGSIKAVIGPNGAGKTTLFNLISGFLAPDTGAIIFDGAEVHGLPAHEIAGRGHGADLPAYPAFPEDVGPRERHDRPAPPQPGRFPRRHAEPARYAGTRSRGSARSASRSSPSSASSDRAGTEATSLAYGQQRIVELAAPSPANRRCSCSTSPRPG